MEKYFVTYCVFDQEAGANPLHHAGILLSKTNAESTQMRVMKTWGFYGLPTTGDRTTWLNQLKLKVGMDVDLYDSHGILKHEELRFLDLGCGLNGVTFELTEDAYTQFDAHCEKWSQDEKDAINEIAGSAIKGKPSGKARIYAQEQYGPTFYKVEQIKAKEQGRASRLKAFELCLTFTLWGPSLATSSTCKSVAIELLSTVLTEKQINRLTVNGAHPTVPRFSGPMEQMYLYSTGPMREHKKTDGTVVQYRDWSDPGVELLWTLPPQELEALSKETEECFKIDSEYRSQVKSAVRKLQLLANLFQNAEVPAGYKNYKEGIVLKLIDIYKSFFSIEPKKPTPVISGLKSLAMSLFNVPRSEDESIVQHNLARALSTFNSLYMAIVDEWTIDLDCEAEKALTTENLTIVEGEDDIPYTNPLECIASYLSMDDQKKLCRIIGRNYVKDEHPVEEQIEDSTQMLHGIL